MKDKALVIYICLKTSIFEESRFVFIIVSSILQQVITMDLGELSPSSIEDEQCNKGNSRMKSESDKEVVHHPISIPENSTQCSNQRLQKYDETGQSEQVSNGSRGNAENENLKVQEGRSSLCTFGKDSESNMSSIESNENLKTSESLLSFTSSEATWGSSSSDDIFSDAERVDYPEKFRKRYKFEDVSNFEPFWRLPPTAVENMSNSPSTTSSSGIDFDNESHTTDWAFTGFEGSSLEDSNSLKSQELCNNFAAMDLQSLPKRRLPNRFQSKEFPSKIRFSRILDSDESSDIEKLSSNNIINAPELLEKEASNNIREDETSEISSVCGATGGFYAYDSKQQTSIQKEDKSVRRKVKTEPHTSSKTSYLPTLSSEQKEDKSVRRKVKTELPTSSKTNSLSTGSSLPSVSSSLRKVRRSLLQISKSLEEISSEEDDSNIYETYGKRGNVGRSLLQITKSLEQTSSDEDDRNIYETYGRSGAVKYFSPKPWVKKLISPCSQNENTNTTPRLDTGKLLKEVHHFFENNRVESEEILNWKERKYNIITSKYFSDEFSQSHGLLSNEEYLKNLKRHTPRYLRNHLKLQKLCRTLIEYSVSEKDFTDYFHELDCDGCRDMDSINQEHRKNCVKRLLFLIEKDTEYEVMLKLYRKLMWEEASFLSILNESRKPYAAEERFRFRDLRSISENSTQVPRGYLAGNQSTNYAAYLPVNRILSKNKSSNIECRSSREGNMLQNDESTADSYQTDSRESKETSSVVKLPDSNALDSSVTTDNAPCNETTRMLASKATEMLESSAEQSLGKDRSNISAEDLGSKVDRTVDSEE